MIGIEAVISTIIGLGVEGTIDNIKKQELVIRALTSLGLKPGIPPDDFDSIYAYTLVEYGIGMPKPILEFYRNDFIKMAFRQSFEKNDYSVLDDEASQFIQWNKVGEEFRHLDIDIRATFREFEAIFFKLVAQSRRPTQVMIDQKLDSINDVLHTNIHLFQGEFDELKERIDTSISPLSFKIGLNKNAFIGHIPLLPDYYVSRTEYISKLIQLLEEDRCGEKRSRGIAVLGFAGVGKSTLVLALLNQEKIKDYFPSGILWASLGPDIKEEQDTDPILSEWILSLGLNPEDFPNISNKLMALRLFIRDENRLIVLDDVWNHAPARLLISICSDNTKFIITTRNKELVSRLGITSIVELDKLKPREARQLIEKRLGKQISDLDWDGKVIQILDRVDWNALATSLTAAQISIGDRSWVELSREFDELKPKLPTDFDEPRTREEGVKFSIDLSVRQLDKTSKERFAWLGIMARGEYLDLEDIAMLWGRLVFPDYSNDELDVEEDRRMMEIVRKEARTTIKNLYQLGLVNKIQIDDDNSLYYLHSLVHEYSLRLLIENGDLDRVIFQHVNVYFYLLISCNPSDPRNVFTYIEKQVVEMLNRAWRTINNEPGILLPEIELAKHVLCTSVEALRYHWMYGAKNEKLITWLERAIQIIHEEGDRTRECDLLRSLAFCQMRLGDKESALRTSHQALAISFELGIREEIADSYGSLSTMYNMSSDYDKGIDYAQKALETLGEINNKSIQGRVYGNLGLAYNSKHESDQAIDWFSKSLQIAHAENDIHDIGQRTGNLASAYCQKAQDMLQMSLMYLRESIWIARAIGNRDSEGNQLVNMGSTYLSLGNLQVARVCFEESLKILTDIKSVRVKDPYRLLNIVNGEENTPPVPITNDHMVRLTYDVISGDQIARHVLLPWLDAVRVRDDPDDDSVFTKELAKALSAIISGERDTQKLITGVSDDVSINIQAILMNLIKPGLGAICIGLLNTTREIIIGKIDAMEVIDSLKQAGDKNEPKAILLREISICFSMLVNGERDVDILTSVISDNDVALFMKTGIRTVYHHLSNPSENGDDGSVG